MEGFRKQVTEVVEERREKEIKVDRDLILRKQVIFLRHF